MSEIHPCIENATFEQIGEVLRARNSFILLSHVRPDGDAIGSQLALGFALLAHREALNLASGLLVILFGLFTAGLLRPAWLQRELRWHGDPPGRGPVAAYLLGTAFAFGWTPCIGPVLGAILADTASAAAGKGVALRTVYSLGLGVPFVAAALFLSGFVARLRTLRWFGRALQLVGGGVMVAMGLLMVTDRMSAVASLLVEAFPVLGRIGLRHGPPQACC